MQDSLNGPFAGAPDEAARPYGLIGLVLSTVAILAATMLAVALLAAAAFGVTVALVGWNDALRKIADLDPSAGHDNAFVQRLGLVVSFVVYGLVVAIVLAAARLRGDRRWRDLVAWRPWHPFRGARLFWIVVVVTLAYSVGANFVVEYVYPQSHEWVQAPRGVVWSGLFVLLAVVVAPVAEEILFRGWIYTSLRASIGIWAGIVVSAILFALAHWEKTHLYALAVFPVGLALGFMRERTGSIKTSMTFHALYNGFASILLLFGQ